MANFGHEGDRLSAFLDDELDERDALAVTRHVTRCAECRGELEELRGTRAALRSLPQVEPSLAWMVETAVLGPGDARRSRFAPASLATVAVALVVVGSAFVLGDDTGEVRPAVEQLVVDHVRSVDGGPVVVPVRLETAP